MSVPLSAFEEVVRLLSSHRFVDYMAYEPVDDINITLIVAYHKVKLQNGFDLLQQLTKLQSASV